MRPMGDDLFEFHTDLLFLDVAELIFDESQRFNANNEMDDYGLKWDVYMDNFKINRELISYIDYLSKMRPYASRQMPLPQNTLCQTNSEMAEKKIHFESSFFLINITIGARQSYPGLGEWRWILEYDEEKASEFRTSDFDITLSAKFERTRSGHPKMPKYMKWVNAIFDDLESRLDADKQLASAKMSFPLYRQKPSIEESTR